MRAYVLACLACLSAYVLTCLARSRACVFTCLVCLFALCPYVVTCLTCLLCSSVLRAYVLACFSLREKVSKYGVFSGLYFPAFRLNTGKYGPEKTLYLDTFHAVSLTSLVLFSLHLKS